MRNENIEEYDLPDQLLYKRVAYNWTVVAMVLSAIVNFLYDIRTYEIVNSFKIVGVTMLYSIGTVIVSCLFTLYGYSILEWRQKNKNCSNRDYMLKCVLFAIFGMCLNIACIFLKSKLLFLVDEKYIIHCVILVLVFRYITLLSTCSVFVFLISAVAVALGLVKRYKQDGDN